LHHRTRICVGDRRRYLDFTGCGNTVSCNQPLVTAFIVRCLETCHEGFTLADLVSYDAKHNAANGEDNRRRKRSSPASHRSRSMSCGIRSVRAVWSCSKRGDESVPALTAVVHFKFDTQSWKTP
jgi:hypothetical protein